jgi:transposase InsO family protein
MDSWAYRHHIQLDFIRPGKPVENVYIESFNSRMRGACLNTRMTDESSTRGWLDFPGRVNTARTN